MMLAANCAAAGIHSGGCEATLKPSPSNAFGVQQIPYVFSRHGDLVDVLKFRIRSYAIIKQRPWIADNCSRSCAVRDVATRRGRRPIGPKGSKRSRESIAGNQVQRARSGWAKRRAPRIVAHGKVLCVIPHCRHCIAVVIAHGAGRSELSVIAAQFLNKAVHESAMGSRLLIAVVV